MSFRLSCLLPWVVCAAVTVAAAPQQPFRSSTDTVSIYATVNDDHGRLVPNLTREQFTVRDNGKPVELTVFSSDPQTITITMLLDMSGSMQGRLLWARDAALRLVDELRGDDRARIGTFGVEVAISPHLTSDKAILTRVLREELWPGGGTPLWLALDAAMTSMARERGRRIVLVITDGNDSDGTRVSRRDVRNRAIRDDFMVYAVAINGHDLNDELQDVATESGGGYVIVDDRDDLKQTLATVVDELRHQYVLGFTPATLDGKNHKLEVSLSTKGLTARAPRSYFAGTR